MSLPRYPKYKDSGVEWLGEVPAHWEIKRIKYLAASMEQGWSPQCEGFPVQSEDEWGVLKVGCVNGGVFRPEENKALPPELEPVSVLGLSAGDLLISRANTRELVGGAAISSRAYPRLMLCDKLYRIRLHADTCEPSFLVFYLGAPQVRGQIELTATGASSSMLNIAQSTILELEAPVPLLAEQTAIATFLNSETAKIDELVAEQRRLMELLKEKRQAVISHAVTRGLNPDVSLKPSGIQWLGDVPEHWEVIALKRIADVQTGVAKGKDNSSRETITVPYLRVANVQDGYLDLEIVATMDIPACDLKRYALKHGDVLMNEGGDFDKLGRGCVWESQIEPCITQNHVFAVRPKLVSSAWLNVITSSDFAQFYFMTRSKQSTNLASISSTNLMELPVVLPPAAEQLEILAFVTSQLSSFETLSNEAQRAIDLLQERRTALISAAVTGQIDVREMKL